jgi:hypothetical protein
MQLQFAKLMAVRCQVQVQVRIKEIYLHDLRAPRT